MDTTKFYVMLDASDDNFIIDLRSALGLKEGEKINFTTPQFTRTDGRLVTYLPRTIAEFELLKMLKPENLKKIGCQAWDGDRFKTHWLFPHEWYSVIPDGLEVIDINGEKDIFKQGETDDDIRFGALSYGFIQEHFVNE